MGGARLEKGGVQVGVKLPTTKEHTSTCKMNVAFGNKPSSTQVYLNGHVNSKISGIGDDVKGYKLDVLLP